MLPAELDQPSGATGGAYAVSFVWETTFVVLEEKATLQVKTAQSFGVSAEVLSGTSVTLTGVKGRT